MPTVEQSGLVETIQWLFESGTTASLPEKELLDRFLARGDESAFEAIVNRHGRMVLGVCRHVLSDEHDVEDAFQATFLILVKKAKSIRNRDVLGSWLYGVARRVAVRARADSKRRRSREQIGLDQIDVPDDRDDGIESHEFRAILDRELDSLPVRFRTPLILCDIEGQTHEQAAIELRCPVGTVKSRLARGRERLRSRLVRRGLAMSVLAHDPLSAVSVKLLSQTVRAATDLVTPGALTAGSVTGGTALLTAGMIRTMAMTKLKIAMIASVATGLLGVVGLTAARLIPALRAQNNGRPAASFEPQPPTSPNSEPSRTPNSAAAKPEPVPQKKKTARQPPKRGALRIVRLKHAGDWELAPRAMPNVMEFLENPPFSFNVDTTEKAMFPQDPNLSPFLYLHGRKIPPFDKTDLECLRRHLDPGCGTIFADAHASSPEFDASFRRFVKDLCPDRQLVPIPHEDELFKKNVGFDLSSVQYNKAAGGKRGYPELEGVRIDGHWGMIYSKYDIGSVLDRNANIEAKSYTPESAKKIVANIVIYSTLP